MNAPAQVYPAGRYPWLWPLLLVLAVVLAYANSLSAPFTFDDVVAVTDNPTIRQLATALQPPTNGGTTTGRPLLNLTFALNYAVSGEKVWGYHAANLLIHAGATFVLFGLARRTMEIWWRAQLQLGRGSAWAWASQTPHLLPLLHSGATLVLFVLARQTMEIWWRAQLQLGRGPAGAGPSKIPDFLPFILALLWAVHPLQTESVTCVAQRTESLCGFWYLLTLYCLARGSSFFARGVFSSAIALDPDSGAPDPSGHKAPPTPNRSTRWLALSVLACLAGMATKEVMVTAPLLALLFDRTFLAGSFAAAWRQRRGYYLGLAATWLLLAALVLGIGGTRGRTAGLGLGVSIWEYLLTQCEALVIYLRLSFWPHPLVMDYGNTVVASWQAVWWQGLVVLALLAGTTWALVRRPVFGFLGAWFFVILAPSSSFVPLVSQTIAEHRMYLPLAAVLALVCLAGASRLAPRTFLAAGLVLALAAATATHFRNRVYLDEQALWENVIAHRPANGRAHNNLGRVHHQAGRLELAIASLRRAVELEPANPFHQFNLGLGLMVAERPAEALAPFATAVRLEPTYFYAQRNLGTVLTRLGRAGEALPHFAVARQFDPAPAEVHFHWGVALAQLGRWPEAMAHYAECVRLNPKHAEALANWGTALMEQQAVPEAITRLEAALDLRPDLPDIHFNLGQAYSAQGDGAKALAAYAETVRLDPRHATAQLNLGIALAQAGRLPAALGHLETAVQLRPDDPATHANLGVALALAGRANDALAAYQAALRLQPGDAQAHYNVGFALLEAGRVAEARPYFETAVRLRPNFPAARDLLDRLREMERP